MACHMKVCWGNDLERIGDFIPDVFSALHIAASEIGSDLLKTKLCRPCVSISLPGSPWQIITIYNTRDTICCVKFAEHVDSLSLDWQTVCYTFSTKGLFPRISNVALLPTYRSFTCTNSDMYLHKSETSMRQVTSFLSAFSFFFAEPQTNSSQLDGHLCGGVDVWKGMKQPQVSQVPDSCFVLRPACKANRKRHMKPSAFCRWNHESRSPTWTWYSDTKTL